VPDIADRRVVLLLSVLVVAVLGASLVSAFVPGLEGLLAGWPIVMVVLVVGTIWVLAYSLRR
jgi:hypothetical protein